MFLVYDRPLNKDSTGRMNWSVWLLQLHLSSLMIQSCFQSFTSLHFLCTLTLFCHLWAAAWPTVSPSPAAGWSSSDTASAYLSAVSVAVNEETDTWAHTACTQTCHLHTHILQTGLLLSYTNSWLCLDTAALCPDSVSSANLYGGCNLNICSKAKVFHTCLIKSKARFVLPSSDKIGIQVDEHHSVLSS